MNEIIREIAEAQHVNQQRELERERKKERNAGNKMFLCFVRMQKPDESLWDLSKIY